MENKNIKLLFDEAFRNKVVVAMDMLGDPDCVLQATEDAAYRIFETACQEVAKECIKICEDCVYKTGEFEYNRGRMTCASEIRNKFLK